MIYKRRRPPAAVLVAGSNIIVGCKRVAQVLCEQTSVFVQLLGILNLHAVAGIYAVYAQLYPARHVLSHVYDVALAALSYAHGLHGLHHLHVRTHCSAQRSSRYAHALCRHPFRVIVAHRGPCAQFFAGVIYLAVVLVVGAYRTVGIQFPFVARRDNLLLAVCKLNDEVKTELGIAEVGYLVRLLLLLHGVEAAVAKSYANGVLGGQHLCNVERIIQHSLAIVGRSRCKNLVAHLLSVDVCLIHAQSADVERSTLYGLVKVEFGAQIARAELAVHVLNVPRHGLLQTNPLSAPVGFVEQSDVPHCRLAPVRLAFCRCNLHAPVAWRVAAQLLARISYPLRLVALERCVPEIAFKLCGLFRC